MRFTGNRLTSTSSRTALFAVFPILLALAISALAQPQNNKDKAQSASATTSSAPADIKFWNRRITTMRTDLAGGTPQERADRAVEKLHELPLGTTIDEIELHPINVEGQDGVGFTYQGKILFFIASGDLDKEGGETLSAGTQNSLNALREALQAREDERR